MVVELEADSQNLRRFEEALHPRASACVPYMVSAGAGAEFYDAHWIAPSGHCGRGEYIGTSASQLQGGNEKEHRTVILTEPAEFETWVNAPAAEALQVQRPLPDKSLTVVG